MIFYQHGFRRWGVAGRLFSSVTKSGVIGIAGGVGPAAGVALQQCVIENTFTNGVEQQHLDVFHASRSSDIADRTQYLLGKCDVQPADGIARSVARLCAAASGEDIVVGVPCNTFHAPSIWGPFLQQVEELQVKNLKIVHMLDETAVLASSAAPGATRLGLMSTTGTRESKVYHDLLEPKGYTMVEVPEELQDELHDTIYNTQWGIKAVSPVSPQARDNFVRYSRLLADAGAQAVILGCTEIPLALPEPELHGVPLIDPLVALARGLIREADHTKLK